MISIFIYHTDIEAPLEEAWDFFTQPKNIERVQSFQNLKIESSPYVTEGEDLHVALSVGGIKTKWISEVTKVEPKRRFIDEGKDLPYPLEYWYHEHLFTEADEKTIMVDRIIYEAKLPTFLLNIALRQTFKGRANRIKKYFHEERTSLYR
ncbi:SRPBCC family protein [Salsuginibacillus kocurii]|uniref:SRPBCC family protein n=1 Tax=Salsuginibacillus kocurii TaxID=427078 RepID=UPI00037A9AFD|nr:hypothetical protein [Salsuginibacillus kocurii]